MDFVICQSNDEKAREKKKTGREGAEKAWKEGEGDDGEKSYFL